MARNFRLFSTTRLDSTSWNLSGLDTKQDGQLGGDTRYNVMRDDVITPSLAPEDSMFNAAATAGHQFLIQSVLDE